MLSDPGLDAFALHLARRGRLDAAHMGSLSLRWYREEVGPELCSPARAELLRQRTVAACRELSEQLSPQPEAASARAASVHPIDTMRMVPPPNRSKPEQMVRDVMRAADPAGLRIFEAHPDVQDLPANRARRAALVQSLPGRVAVADPVPARAAAVATPPRVATPALHVLNQPGVPTRTWQRPQNEWPGTAYYAVWVGAAAIVMVCVLSLLGGAR